ncbi:MAG: 50S ribosomal protein L29 [Elusimicrobia bacterium]|nr:50S ribosomal protein L29 [Elusimicrobiota bacterium]
MNSELKKNTNEQLCALLAQLKMKLLEAKFKMSSGELEKLNLLKQMRKMIAQILTELTIRGFKTCLTSYGVVLYDKKNQPTIINDEKLTQILKKLSQIKQTTKEKILHQQKNNIQLKRIKKNNGKAKKH